MVAFPRSLHPYVSLRGARAVLVAAYAERTRALAADDNTAVARLEDHTVRWEQIAGRREAELLVYPV